MKRVFWTDYSDKEIIEMFSNAFGFGNPFCSKTIRRECVREWKKETKCKSCRRVTVEITEKK